MKTLIPALLVFSTSVLGANAAFAACATGLNDAASTQDAMKLYQGIASNAIFRAGVYYGGEANYTTSDSYTKTEGALECVYETGRAFNEAVSTPRYSCTFRATEMRIGPAPGAIAAAYDLVTTKFQDPAGSVARLLTKLSGRPTFTTKSPLKLSDVNGKTFLYSETVQCALETHQAHICMCEYQPL